MPPGVSGERHAFAHRADQSDTAVAAVLRRAELLQRCTLLLPCCCLSCSPRSLATPAATTRLKGQYPSSMPAPVAHPKAHPSLSCAAPYLNQAPSFQERVSLSSPPLHRRLTWHRKTPLAPFRNMGFRYRRSTRALLCPPLPYKPPSLLHAPQHRPHTVCTHGLYCSTCVGLPLDFAHNPLFPHPLTSMTGFPGTNMRLLGLGVGCVWMNMPRRGPARGRAFVIYVGVRHERVVDLRLLP